MAQKKLPSLPGINVLPNIMKLVEKQIDELNNTKIEESTIIPLETNFINCFHKIYDDVIELSTNWQIPDIKQEDLLIKNKNEYLTIMKYRDLVNANHEIITKKVLDSMIVQETKNFIDRNINLDNTPKISTEIPPPIRVELKSKQSPGRAVRQGFFRKNNIL